MHHCNVIIMAKTTFRRVCWNGRVVLIDSRGKGVIPGRVMRRVEWRNTLARDPP
jgi:hypothetical protein